MTTALVLALLLAVPTQAPAMTEEERAIWAKVANNLATAPEWYDPALTAAAVAAQGAAAPTVLWERISGTLPPGLTLDATNGVLSGTPSQAGTFAFTIRAVVGGVFSITRAFSVTIAAATVIDPAPPPPGLVGTPYQHQFKTTTQETIP